ncbi:MAG TPA: C39 family peptidase [Methanosarcina sp.]|jgi:hypothetical protein
MTAKTKFGTGILLLIMMLVIIALVPAVNAQGNDYSVTAEKAFEHANAQIIQFMVTDTDGFGSWIGASIDSKPLELYDINGQKLFYQFSVYKNNKVIGRIYIGANKTLGQSVRLIELDPTPLKVAGAMKKAIETAKKNYSTGEIKSTIMVVYSYPKIGAMTVVKDKTTGVENRVFVDAYTLDVVPDKPANKTEPGVLSIYKNISKSKIDENLNKWQSSDELTKSIEQAATNQGVNIDLPVTEENIKKLSNTTTIGADTVQKTIITPAYFAQKILSVPVYSQSTTYYCQPASAQMIASYYGVSHTQDYIYSKMGGVAPNGINNSQALVYYKSSSGLNKPKSYTTTSVYWGTGVSEIDNNRPFMSGTNDHARVCVGYQDNGYLTSYLRINDPAPPYIGGHATWEAFGSEVDRIYVKS